MSQIRIRAITNLINNKNVVVDVGSDHAKLSKILIDEEKAKTVINIEKNDLPLKNSIFATRDYLFKIQNIKSDGLEAIESSLFIDTCIISGLGGNLIVKILNQATSKNVCEYIIQPNNNEAKIRVWAKKFNWKIKNEFLIEENKIIYEFIVLNKFEGYVPKTKRDFFFGQKNLENKSFLFKKKWTNFLKQKFKENIQKFNFEKRKDLLMVEEILKNES